MITPVAGILAAVALAIPVAPVLSAPVLSAPAPAPVTWTVQPAGEAGPDGRRWIEHTLDPGQVITEHLAVRNLSDSAVTFALKAADGYLTDKGRFNMLPSDQKSVDGGTWIAVQESVSVPPQTAKVVPFTITVPEKATPGDHPAGIAATVLGRQGTVQVESRVGFRVLLRASGTLQPALTVTDLRARFERSWNPLHPGTVQVAWTAANTGNVRLEPRARIESADLLGSTAEATVGELLPGGTRAVSARVDGVWGLGRVRTTVSFSPADNMPEVSVTTWVVPWPQLLLAAALVALLLAWRAVRRRRKRHLEALLAQARLEGARSR
ncbi:DUF916 domain-containing protein [Actinoplanes sp. NPDC051861]|uniref:WxL protein peptidoglycan domain-containing protein n=1 Tax=Actinoplanes sp. NPDC051861 TaxID=3155170 RepID=UPI003440F7B2